MYRRRKIRKQDRIPSEIQSLPARCVPALPLPVTLWLDVPGAPVPICFSTAAQESTQPYPGLAPVIVFDRDELRAIVAGAEQDRMWRKELLALCFEKWRRPALRVALPDTLAGAVPSDDVSAWSLQRVLDRVGATLLRVDVAGVDPRPSLLPAAA